MRSGFILLSVFVFSVSSAQYKGQNIRVDSLKANAMILQSGELPLGWPQDTLRVVIDTVNSIAPKVNKLYTGDDDEGGILPPSMVRDSIRYAIENAVGGGIPMPDTTEQGGKFLRYNGTEETPFDWAVAGSVQDSTWGSVTTDTLTSSSASIHVKKNFSFAPSIGFGTAGSNAGSWFSFDTTLYSNRSTVITELHAGATSLALDGPFIFWSYPNRSYSYYFQDLWSTTFGTVNEGGTSQYYTSTAPHALLNINRYGPRSYVTVSGTDTIIVNGYDPADDIKALAANFTTNSHVPTQAGDVKAVDFRMNVGGETTPSPAYTANGSYTPARAFGGHFELNNYARAKIPIGYGVRARVNNAHSNDSTRYGFAAGFKYSQPFWAYGGYDTLYGIHLDDPKYGDVRAAIGLRDTGLIAWKWDTFLKRTGAGNLNLDTNLTVSGTTATGNLRIENLGDGLLTTESGDVVVSAIVPNILPDTSGDAGKYLQYTGAGFDWVAETSVDSANFEKKNTIRQLFTSGLIDSVKTTDTLFLGAIYPAATVDTLRVDALGAVDVTMIVEMVDSLNQSSGQTPVCTTTVTNARKLISSFDEAALLNGKILRVRFTTVGTMPKQIIISVLGHR